MKLSIDFTIIFLRNSTISIRLYISYYNYYLFILATYIVTSNRYASSLTSTYNFIAFTISII